MISVDLIGRLGNQMFQYAFAKNTAEKLKTYFVFNPVYENEITKYFQLDIITHLLFTKLGFKLNQRLVNRTKIYNILQQNAWQNTISIENHTQYKGFFQSELFFEENRQAIKEAFAIKKPWVNKFDQKYGELFSRNKTLVIHIRRTDYIDFGSPELGGVNLCLPISYYNRCIDLISNINDYSIICISDDIEYAKRNLNIRKEIFFESNDVIEDFQLMLNADVLIIANSSFAWWAAYLNGKENKVVYSPKYWLGFKVDIEYPSGITPVEFTAINTNIND